MTQRFLRFTVVGLMGILVQLASLGLLVKLAHVHYHRWFARPGFLDIVVPPLPASSPVREMPRRLASGRSSRVDSGPSTRVEKRRSIGSPSQDAAYTTVCAQAGSCPMG